jgi:hypothetical protein
MRRIRSHARGSAVAVVTLQAQDTSGTASFGERERCHAITLPSPSSLFPPLPPLLSSPSPRSRVPRRHGGTGCRRP